MQVNMLEAKSALSRLVVAAERGEEVILARDGKPVAKIVRYEAPKVKLPGVWKDKVKLSPDWDSRETNAEVAALFEQSALRGI
ncbi:MAG: type II toxin-antitoxin system Phd/YefM family antitoxin [Azonexus sp.]|jgi:antitoxin (DNA-binding transcriptional repressor) of toxin-antitoxin stability system|nr:type II toxin-antitoxin system Phd/YefM family antitoxin [Azonexus sp.]